MGSLKVFFRVLQIFCAAVLSSIAWAQDTWDVPVDVVPGPWRERRQRAA